MNSKRRASPTPAFQPHIPRRNTAEPQPYIPISPLQRFSPDSDGDAENSDDSTSTNNPTISSHHKSSDKPPGAHARAQRIESSSSDNPGNRRSKSPRPGPQRIAMGSSDTDEPQLEPGVELPDTFQVDWASDVIHDMDSDNESNHDPVKNPAPEWILPRTTLDAGTTTELLVAYQTEYLVSTSGDERIVMICPSGQPPLPSMSSIQSLAPLYDGCERKTFSNCV